MGKAWQPVRSACAGDYCQPPVRHPDRVADWVTPDWSANTLACTCLATGLPFFGTTSHYPELLRDAVRHQCRQRSLVAAARGRGPRTSRGLASGIQGALTLVGATIAIVVVTILIRTDR